jgi:general secretion pathway protein L
MKVLNFVRLHSLLQGQLPSVLLKSIQVALVPTEDVLLMYSTLPLMSTRKLRQAAPFSVEEACIEEIETLHFAIGPQEKTGRFPIAMVKKSLLKNWIETLNAQRIGPDYMLPEVLALSYMPNMWHIFLLENKALIRIDEYMGVSVELKQLPTVLPLLFKEYGLPNVLYLSYTAEHAHYEVAELAVPGLILNKAEHPTTADIEFTLGLPAVLKKINLLESAHFLKELKGKADVLHRPYGKWIRRTFWAVALFWIISQLTLILIFNYHSRPIEAQIRTLYYSVMPSETPFNDVQDRINQQVETVYQAPASFFLNAMIALGAELKSHHGTVVIHQLDFKDNQLVLQVTAPELQTLTKISTALGGQQYTVQVTEVKTDSPAEHVTAKMTIGKTV